MSIFSNPTFFLIGISVLLMVSVLFFWSEKKKKSKLLKITSIKLLPRLLPYHSQKRKLIKFGLFGLAVLLLSFAFARPQWGAAKRMSTPKGIDLLIAIDVSKSMLARDIKPNRLERVKLSISNLIGDLKGDRVGLIAFAGSAFLQCPLTLDHQAFINTLKNLQVGTIKAGGTNLASPINEAARSFSKDDRDKFLVLISDGEDLEGEGLKRAKEAYKEGIKIYTIGIGSEEGARIPTDPLNLPARNFLLNPEGKTVVTRLDEASLQAISKETNAKYFPIGSTGQGLVSVFSLLKSLGEKKVREQVSTEIPIERFQPFLLVAILILLFEKLTPSTARNLGNLSNLCLAIAFFFLGGCIKQDNIRRAEEAEEKQNWNDAAKLYDLEFNASSEESSKLKTKMILNAGLAYLKAGNYNAAKDRLEKTIDLSMDFPDIQSMALNELGNIYYKKTNEWLDQQNVMQARMSWNRALEYYESAFEVNGNSKASENLASLKAQIENRIKKMVSMINGRIWRDTNGDGILQKNEKRLYAKVFWDKNNDGEHNSSNEPSLETNEAGEFAFEWISSSYPTLLHIDSELIDKNKSDQKFLLPVFPAPPPPQNSDQVRNFPLKIETAGATSVILPYRSAPIIQGRIWADTNGDANLNNGEAGFAKAKIFLDDDGNFQLDENETSFNPDSNGSFAFPAPPGQYSVCVLPENPDANITFPIEDKKAYLTWIDYESPSSPLIFGVQDNSEEESQSSDNNQSQPQDSSPQNQDQKNQSSENQNNVQPQEVNALYERLLQEMESKSKKLEEEQIIGTVPNGRDY